MNIELTADTPFGDENHLRDFLLVNYVDHERISSFLQRNQLSISGVPVSGDEGATKDWMQDHYQTHVEIGTRLHLSVPDLADYDMKKKSDFEEWMYIHSMTHKVISEAMASFVPKTTPAASVTTPSIGPTPPSTLAIWDNTVVTPTAFTLTLGGRTATDNGFAVGVPYCMIVSSTSRSSGRWYCEVVYNAGSKFGTNIPPEIGFVRTFFLANQGPVTQNYVLKGAKGRSGSALAESFPGDIIMLAIDIDNQYVWIGRNGSWFSGGDPGTGASPLYSAIGAYTWWVGCCDNTTYDLSVTSNFRSAQCSYALPTGFAEWG